MANLTYLLSFIPLFMIEWRCSDTNIALYKCSTNTFNLAERKLDVATYQVRDPHVENH